jgi:hypothetical protein
MIIHMGMLPPIKVTLIGVDVSQERYTSALYEPTPSKPSQRKRILFCQIGPSDLSNFQPMGSKMMAANIQRKVLSMMGEISPTAKRPTMALPAQRIVGNTK